LNVLALNPGSSSLRFQVAAVEGTGDGSAVRRLGGGSLARLGGNATARTRVGDAEPQVESVPARDHVGALEWSLAWLASRALGFDAIGVRVVHGGGSRVESAFVDERELSALRRGCDLAPLHDRPGLQVIERVRAIRPAAPRLVAVFDSAFHADLPEVARTYALPHELCERHAIQRVGFHGIALRSIVERLSAIEGRLPRKLVAAHLGSGCSVTALLGGRSLDTSMGFTPLEGLVMSTRSGDLDPSLVAFLARAEGCSSDEVVDLLNRRSGLLGCSGASGDLREIEVLRSRGEPRATLAFEVFAHRARKYVAAMMAVLRGADAIAFSGGIGENSPAMRAAILHDMGWCGVALDSGVNAAGGVDRRISQAGSPVAVFVVGVDEEACIARAACERLQGPV